MRGPEQLVLRLPRDGGTVRAYAYPTLDSLVWTSHEGVPHIARVLAFNYEAGSIAAVDTKGTPVRVDLRLGDATRESGTKLTHLTSSDGSAIFGLDANGKVVRLMPNGDWSFKPPTPARDIFPEPDGALLVLADTGHSTTIWQIRPPESTIVDTVVVHEAGQAMLTPIGDRLYLVSGSSLLSVQTRGLNPGARIELSNPVRALAITPSGDRLYVVTDSSTKLVIIDRYAGKVAKTITLPGQASELRMDPMGRYVLARAATGDSVWVVAVATDRVNGTVRTAWRDDLPAVGADGEIALVSGTNVLLVDGESLSPLRTVRDGADDVWLFAAWNGFRPRAEGLDEPVAFDSDSVQHPDLAQLDSTTINQLPNLDTQTVAVDTSATRVDSARVDSAVYAARGFTVQFAAVRSAQSAQDVAHSLMAAGVQPRVVPSTVAGVTIFRVLMGPFPTRAAADSAGRASGKPYWIYEGTP